MELDLSKWSQRCTYFLGRFYDRELQLLLMRVLRPGDRFVDVGANIGMVTLLASRLVGPSGVVDTFEPNPRCVEAIRAAVVRNGIANVRIHAAALGDAEATLPLVVPRYNTGEGTLAAGADDFAGQADRVDVPVRVGDDVLAEDPRPAAFVKIDVEGFEHRALSGLRRTLSEHRPLVLTEVVAAHLARDGRVPADLFELMGSLGYAGHRLELTGRSLTTSRFHLAPASDGDHGNDILWVPEGMSLAERLDLVTSRSTQPAGSRTSPKA
jgi:FkbM family methyltransferase